MTPRPSLVCRWADVVLAGVVINLAALLILPLARPDLDLFKHALSYYTSGPWAILQSVGFVAMGIASLALAIGLTAATITSRWLPLCVAMLVVSGIASFGIVAFPMGAPGPATFIGDTHQTAGTIGGVAQLIAALAFTLAVRTNPRWSNLFKPALLAFAVSTAAAMLTQIAIWWPERGIPMGAVMRLVVIPLILLWGFVALRLRRTCPATLSRSSVAM
jgi:hypothetical protein